MVNFCAVNGCSSRSGKGCEGVSFYRIPQIRTRMGNDYQELQKVRRLKWILSLKRKDITEKKIEHFRICSKHFISGKPADLLNKSDPDWTPTLNMGHTLDKSVNTGEPGMNRFERARMRELNTLIQNPNRPAILSRSKKPTIPNKPQIKSTQLPIETVKPTPVLTPTMKEEPPVKYILRIETPVEIPVKPQEEANSNDKSIQTDMTMDSFNELESIKKELVSRNDMVYQLRDKVGQLMFSEKYVASRRDVLLYYTGLPTMELFSMILSAISDCLEKNSSLTPHQQLFSTLMKLRLDMTFSILSFQFLVSRNLISRTFYKVINLLSASLKNNIIWPEKDSYQENLPTLFKKYFNNEMATIIDVIEIQIQKPSNSDTKSETWSNEKQKNTIKFLIGVTPASVICFLSDGYGGSTSDCNIILESGLLDNLNLGDSILMNRDITSSGEGFRCATLNLNAKGEKILEVADLAESKKIDSAVINYVDKVLSNIKSKFSIMNGPLPVEMLQVKNGNSVINEIMTVCCALINLSCPTVQLV